MLNFDAGLHAKPSKKGIMLFLRNTVASESYLSTQGWRLQSSGKLPTP